MPRTLTATGNNRTALMPKKTKTVAVCKCGLQKESCDKCGEGFLERTLRGEAPLFIQKEVSFRKAAVCACGLEKAECSACGKGFLTVTKEGKVPTFIDVEVVEGDDSKKNTEPGLALKVF